MSNLKYPVNQRSLYLGLLLLLSPWSYAETEFKTILSPQSHGELLTLLEARGIKQKKSPARKHLL